MTFTLHQGEVVDVELMLAENARLRSVIAKAENILGRNLGHQTEKCFDALAILRAVRLEKE